MNGISQMEDLAVLDKKALCERVIKLEMFIRNLAQKFFAQDDFSRKETARHRDGEARLVVNGHDAFEHWLTAKGPTRFARDFPNVDSIVHAFCQAGVGEKPPPPD